MHEAAHALLLPRRRWNDWLAELALSWPVFVTMRSYRARHLDHHRFTNTDHDADWVLNRPQDLQRSTRWFHVLAVLLGFNRPIGEVWKCVQSYGLKRPGSLGLGFTAARVTFYLGLLSLLLAYRLVNEFLIYWIVPLLTWCFITMRLRGIAEHFAVENNHAYALSRTIQASWFERLFIAPHNVHYHIEHHLYPSVPCYRLPQLHVRLMSLPEYRAKIHLTHSYWGVLQECFEVALGHGSSQDSRALLT